MTPDVMPEGDTIAYAAQRMRPVLEGHVPERSAPRIPATPWTAGPSGWPAARSRRSAPTASTCSSLRRGSRLHSHLRMTGTWGVYAPGRRWGRSPRLAWLVLERGGHQVVQFNGPVLELMTEAAPALTRGWPRWVPTSSADDFDSQAFLARLRADDPTRGIGEALLDQRNVAGIGNIWKSEGCWEAALDPWRPVVVGERRGGDGGHRRGAAADAAVGAARAHGGRAARVSPRRTAVPALRRRRCWRGPGGRQPHRRSGAPAASADRSRRRAAY